MGMIAVWRRSVLGAGGVALLLPIGLAMGVLLTSALGGAGALRALSQVFAGPTLPGGRAGSVSGGLESSRQVPQVPPAPRSAARAGARAPSGARGGATPGGGRAPGAPAPRPAVPHRPVTPPSGGGGTGGGGSAPGGSAGTPPPASPAPTPGPLHQTGQQALDAVRHTVPAAAPVADAAQTVVDLLP